MQKLADIAHYNADRITVINGFYSFMNHLVIKSAENGFDKDNLNKITFVKNPLGYFDDFSRSVAKSSFWYLDTNTVVAIAN